MFKLIIVLSLIKIISSYIRVKIKKSSMSDNILQSIYSFTKNYRDPDTNNVFDEKNEKIYADA